VVWGQWALPLPSLGRAQLQTRVTAIDWPNAAERVAGAVVGFALVIAAWWIAANALGPSRLPTPSSVASVLFSVLDSSVALRSQGVAHGIGSGLVYTVERVFLGVGLGAAIGITIGILMGVSKSVNEFLSSVIEVIRTIPPLAAVPFFLIWFGTGPIGQLLVIAFYSTVMIVVSARAAVQHISPIYEEYAATLGADWFQRVRTIVLPAILPELIGGVRVALAFSWGIEVVAELLGSQQGIGFDFVLLSTVLQVNEMIAAIIWIAVIAAVVDKLYVLATGYFTRWVPRAA
jgi:ABC-type nitrate/sulfonate/bicarbonate transport system permease component